MARPNSDTLTEREARIMNVLWERGAATAEHVRAILPDHPHDSSVRTLLRVLESKGYVRHEPEGRRFVYRPLVERHEAQRGALRNLETRLFDGLAEELVIRLIEDGQISDAAWERIKRAYAGYRRAVRH